MYPEGLAGVWPTYCGLPHVTLTYVSPDTASVPAGYPSFTKISSPG